MELFKDVDTKDFGSENLRVAEVPVCGVQ